MPLPIQVGSVTQALQRAFGFKGRYTPMLDEVIVPVYVVQDPAPAVVTRIAAGTVTVPEPGDGEFVHVSLWNPPTSGVLAVVNSVFVQVSDAVDGTTSDPHTFIGKIKAAPVQPGGAETDSDFRDARLLGNEPALSMFGDLSVLGPAGPSIAQILFPSGATGSQPQLLKTQSSDPRQPLAVLAPGSLLELVNLKAGLAADLEPKTRASFQWLEIPITEQSPLGGLPGT